jgi:hypothetical protein
MKALSEFLSQIQKNDIPQIEELKEILQGWLKSEPAPYLMMAIAGVMVTKLPLDFPSFTRRCLVSISKYIPIRKRTIDDLRYVNDPRITQQVRPGVNPEVNQNFLGEIHSLRRPSLLLKSIRPHFNALYDLTAKADDIPTHGCRKIIIQRANRIMEMTRSIPCIESIFIPELSSLVFSWMNFQPPDIERQYQALRLEILQTREPSVWMTFGSLAMIYKISKRAKSNLVMLDVDAENRSNLKEIIHLCNSLIIHPNMRTRRFTQLQIETLDVISRELFFVRGIIEDGGRHSVSPEYGLKSKLFLATLLQEISK